MPSAALRPCAEPRCPTLVAKGRCAVHARAKEQQRYNADTRKWYHTKAWKTRRAITLAEQPVCAICRVAPSTEADHIVPHRGNYQLFLGPLQGLCHACHGRKTASGQ